MSTVIKAKGFSMAGGGYYPEGDVFTGMRMIIEDKMQTHSLKEVSRRLRNLILVGPVK